MSNELQQLLGNVRVSLKLSKPQKLTEEQEQKIIESLKQKQQDTNK